MNWSRCEVCLPYVVCRSTSTCRAKAKRRQSEGMVGLIWVMCYYSYTEKGKNQGATFEKKKVAVIGTR